jgi:hypothetical protein
VSGFPHNDVERSLDDAAAGRLDLEEWLRAFVDATVWVPLTAASGQQGTFPVLSIDGGSYVPVFTSEAEADRAAPRTRRIAPVVRELVASLPESVGLAVNPGGSVGLPLPAGTLRQVIGLGRRVAAGTTVRIGEPAEEPEELLDAVAAALVAVPAVRSARRCWAAVGENRPGLVIGLDVDPDNQHTRAAALDTVRAAADAAAGDFPVDVVFENDGDEFTGWMAAHVQPFFVAG